MEGTEFVNDLCCNYLTVPYEGDGQEFALRMMTENATDEFLPVELRRIDGQSLLYYNISGMQNMEALYTERQVDRKDFRTFMWQLHEAMELSSELFLSGDGICLEPSCIFRDLGEDRWKLVYIPGQDAGRAKVAQREKEKLAEFLVMHMDHGDKELTDTVYRFYEEVCAGGGFSRRDVFGEGMTGACPVEGSGFKGGQTGEDFFERDAPGQCLDGMDRSVKGPVGRRGAEEEPSGTGSFEETAWEESDTEEESGKSSDSGGKKGRTVLKGLLVLAIAVTAAAGKIMPEMVVPGGAVSVLLAAALFFSSLKHGKDLKSLEDEPEEEESGNPEEDVWREALSGGGYGEEAPAMEEKTVFMDIQSGQERKLYGIGKFRRHKIFLDKLPCLVGKDKTLVNHTIQDVSVSRMHARFFAQDEAIWMQDLNSTNGTYHNGMRLRPNEKVILEPEDEVGFGQAQFVFR